VLLVALLCLASCWDDSARAAVELPSIIGNNMVLQQQTDAAIWGWDVPGTKVKVAFRGNEVSALADLDGKWLVRVPSRKAGGPFRLKIKGTK